MRLEYKKLPELHGYVGLTYDFKDKEGYKIREFKKGVCIIEEHPADFLKKHKVLEVHYGAFQSDARVVFLDRGVFKEEWDTDNGEKDPLCRGLTSLGLHLVMDQNHWSFSYLGIQDHVLDKMKNPQDDQIKL